MTTRTTTVELAESLESALQLVNEEDRRNALTLTRLLGEGEPVEAERLAAALGRSGPDVAKALAEIPGIYRDARERVVGSWGLSVFETPHRLRVEGRELYAWCAWDSLFLPVVLGEEVEVENLPDDRHADHPGGLAGARQRCLAAHCRDVVPAAGR